MKLPRSKHMAETGEATPKKRSRRPLDRRTGLSSKRYFLMRASQELQQAASYSRKVSMVVCLPQIIPGEDDSEALKIVGSCIRKLVRDVDLAGPTDDGVGVVLVETSARGAQSLAQRLRSELGLRGSHLRAPIWLVGVATFPEDGQHLKAMLSAARVSARASRRDAAA